MASPPVQMEGPLGAETLHRVEARFVVAPENERHSHGGPVESLTVAGAGSASPLVCCLTFSSCLLMPNLCFQRLDYFPKKAYEREGR